MVKQVLSVQKALDSVPIKNNNKKMGTHMRAQTGTHVHTPF